MKKTKSTGPVLCTLCRIYERKLHSCKGKVVCR